MEYFLLFACVIETLAQLQHTQKSCNNTTSNKIIKSKKNLYFNYFFLDSTILLYKYTLNYFWGINCSTAIAQVSSLLCHIIKAHYTRNLICEVLGTSKM